MTLAEQILLLHKPVKSFSGKEQCEHCAEQCHSHSGLNCDDPDASYPCLTAQIALGTVVITK